MDDFAEAAVAGDGARFAALFTEDGCYHDVFYGLFEGRAAIADMLENRFHRDAENFRWDMHRTSRRSAPATRPGCWCRPCWSSS
jgi:hypothetical protein